MGSIILGRGREAAEIMIVGDSPTKDDVTSELAISGQTEKTLRSLFRENKYNIDQTYRTLYIKNEISYNGHDKKKLSQAIAEAHASIAPDTYDKILTDEILYLKPNVVVPIGELSFRAVSGQKGIEKFRGSVLPLRPEIQSKLGTHVVRTIPVLGPVPYLNQDPSVKFLSKLDISKVVRDKDRSDPIKEVGFVWVCKSLTAFREFLERNRKPEFLTFDIETIYGLPICISFCFDGNEACTVPLIDKDIDEANSVLLWIEIARLLASNIPKVNQNIKYDWRIMERFGWKVNNIVGDTQVAAGVIYPEFPKNLGFLTSIYTDMPYFKSEGKEYDPKIHSKDRLYLYCAKDSAATWKIHKIQQQELEELSLTTFYNERQFPLFFVYKELEDTGILIDTDERNRLSAKYEVLFNVYQNTLRSMLSDSEFNPRSPKQVTELIYDKLKYPIKRNKRGNPSSEEEVLEELMVVHNHGNEEGTTLLELVIACRKLAKVLEYINTYTHQDNRMRCSYNLSGTENGRTSANPSIDRLFIINEKGKVEMVDIGRSLQTITKHGFKVGSEVFGKDIRRMYVSKEGFSLVEGDLSQAEARVDAVLANDLDMLPVFDKPPGIHCITGSWVFGCQPSEIKKGTSEYHLGKTVRHAGERNMGPTRLAMMIHEPLSFCTNLLAKFHTNQPKIRRIFHNDVREFIKGNLFLQSPTGRRRDFFGRLDEHLYNEAISYLPQAIVSDTTKQAMNLLRNHLLKDEFEAGLWRFNCETHDACMAEVRDDFVPTYAESLKKAMEQEIDFTTCSLSRDFKLKIPCEVKVGRNWQDYSDANPDGMKDI